MPEFSPEALHNHLLQNAPRILRFDPEAYFPEWQSAARRTFKQLLGIMPNKVPLDLQIQSETQHEQFTEIQFHFTSEPHVQVPCTLVIPRNSALSTQHSPFPLIICLQGHSPGAHISLGRKISPTDSSEGDRDFALQAIQQGYAALVLEQRAFGQRSDARAPELRQHLIANDCHHAALVALLLGRTLAGERVLDVSRAIDALTAHFPQIDPARIACLGHSGGGTIAYYAAAFDPRIAAIIPSCCLSTYRHSIGTISHCADNYLPNILHYFDMADLAGLIVPRPLIAVAGQTDPYFPIAGVQEFFTEAREIYTAQNAPDKIQLIIGPEDHRFYAAQTWPIFKQLTGW